MWDRIGGIRAGGRKGDRGQLFCTQPERVFEKETNEQSGAQRGGAESQHKREKKKTITSTSSCIFLNTRFNPGYIIHQSKINTSKKK
jgi:hypothetical protein